MRLVVTVLAALALLAGAQDARASFRGYLPPEWGVWIAEAKTQMPMPRGTVKISASDCPGPSTSACWRADWPFQRGGTLYMAAGEERSTFARRFVLLHEIGHAVDTTRLTTALRRRFLRLLGLGCSWWESGPRGCKPYPPEIFAEQYAACAAGVPRRSLLGTEAGFYPYAPPLWLGDKPLCDLIRSV